MRHAIIAVLAILMLAAPVHSQEPEPQVLYCTDEGVAGFKWDEKGNAQIAPFNNERFTVKIVSGTKRSIHWQGMSFPMEYTCSQPIGLQIGLHCDGGTLSMPIIFGPIGYTRAYLFGLPPLTGGQIDRNIAVAYGTCTKF